MSNGAEMVCRFEGVSFFGGGGGGISIRCLERSTDRLLT